VAGVMWNTRCPVKCAQRSAVCAAAAQISFKTQNNSVLPSALRIKSVHLATDKSDQRRFVSNFR
jgi:hypothetical protein